MSSALSRIGRSFKSVYKPAYIALNIVVAALYYLLFVLLIRYQNYGILITGVPKLLLYALVVTSSVMFTIGVYAMKKSLKRKTAASASAVGTAMTLFAGVIAGCGCSAPLIYSITIFGLSVAEISVLAAFITTYSAYIVSAIVVVNVLLILYYSLKISGRKRAKL